MVLIVAELTMAAAALGMAIWSWLHGPVPVVYGLLLLFGLGRTFQTPARQALLPAVVPAGSFTNAVTWSSGGWQIAEVAGPAVGGAIVALTHAGAPVYLINALSAIIFTVLLFGVSTVNPPAERRPASWKGLLDGLRFVRNSQVLLAAITLDLFAVLLGGATTLLPVYAKDILHVGPSGLGWLLAAQSIGAVSMSVSLAHRPPFMRAGRTLLWAVVGFGASIVLFGLSRSFLLSLACLLTAGAFDSISVVIRLALSQLKTPDDLRGRVSAINSLFIGTSNELGGFESGAMASIFGPVISVVSGGIGTILVVGVVALAWPGMRKLERLED
jgi:MFS family permease